MVLIHFPRSTPKFVSTDDMQVGAVFKKPIDARTLHKIKHHNKLQRLAKRGFEFHFDGNIFGDGLTERIRV